MLQGGQAKGDQLSATYLYRGVAYFRKSNYDNAIADFSEVIKITPNSAVAYNNRGNAYLNKGDNARALADYDQAVKLGAKSAAILNSRCWTKGILGRDLRGALADCNESLQMRPNDADTLDTRGFVYLKMKNTNAAITDYDAALKLNPKLSGSLYGRGLAKRTKGDARGATADIEAARVIKPEIVAEYQRYGLQ